MIVLSIPLPACPGKWTRPPTRSSITAPGWEILGDHTDGTYAELVAVPEENLFPKPRGWSWTDVLATALVGVPVALAFFLLPGPPSLLGVVLVHFGATCGFLGPGPWLLRQLKLL